MHLEATEAVSISSESERLEDLGMGEFQENGGVESQVLRIMVNLLSKNVKVYRTNQEDE